VVLWVKLMQAGYKRSIASLYRMLVKLEIYNKVPSKKKKYEPKLYQPMKYPGERVQVDVKYVPKACMTKKFKYKIEEIQTDNGFEFTKRLQYKNYPNRPKTMFEQKLKELNIKHKLIKPYTPRHNGKVERSHKKN